MGILQKDKAKKGELVSLAEAEKTIDDAFRALRGVIFPVGRLNEDHTTQIRCNQQAWEEIDLVQQIHLLADDYRSKSAEITKLRKALENLELNKEDLENLCEEAREREEDTSASLRSTQESEKRLRDTIVRNEREYEEEFKKEADDHRRDLALAQSRHTKDIEQLEKKHKSEMREKEIELEHGKKSMEIEKEKFQNDLQRLRDRHREEQEDSEAAKMRLKSEIRSRNKAMLAREKTAVMSDGEMKSKFLELLHGVDTIARLEWTSNRSDWTTELQDTLSDNPRRLRKQILLDTIWVILFKHIFCTPYRLLGKAGNKLESQWQQEFGSKALKTATNHLDDTFMWPEPTFLSERWRYETIQQALQTVEKPPSEYSNRQELLQGYKQSLERTQAELRQALEKVSSLDEDTIQSIQMICEKASKLWLTFGAQRCRLCIMIRGLQTTTETVNEVQSEDRSIEFVIRPQLQRYGDSMGELFDSEATIAGCEGESIKILY